MWITGCKLIPGPALELQQTAALALCTSLLFSWIDVIQKDRIQTDIHLYLSVHVPLPPCKAYIQQLLKADIKNTQHSHV